MNRALLTAAATVAVSLGAAQPGHATLMLEISDGTTTQALSDLGNTGIITFDSAIGAFSTNVTTAISKPIIGSAQQPDLDLNSVDVTNRASNGGTLTIQVTDTDFLGGSGIATFLNTIGGTQSAGTLGVNTYLDCGNTPFGQGTLLTSQNFSTTPFSGGASTFVNGCNGSYSLTQVLTLTMPGGAHVSFDSDLALPEPATLALFGAGLIGIGISARRRRKAA